MQIILLEKVINLGGLGDVVKVKDGYARNFLIPQGKARRATPSNLAEFESRRAELEAAQSAALAPGISRSGATLTMALLLNVERPSAARFIFLLSLPAIVAAAAKEGLELAKVGLDAIPVTLFAVGMVTSAIVGYITVKFFVRYLANHSLEVFAYYRFALAAVTVLWLLAR